VFQIFVRQNTPDIEEPHHEDREKHEPHEEHKMKQVFAGEALEAV
jgi:hypothetical protein